MKVLLDTSFINWLTDDPLCAQEFFAARDRGVFETMVPPEVAKEVRDTKDESRRSALEATLRSFFPLTPTRVPRSGSARSGLARISLPADTARLATPSSGTVSGTVREDGGITFTLAGGSNSPGCVVVADTRFSGFVSGALLDASRSITVDCGGTRLVAIYRITGTR